MCAAGPAIPDDKYSIKMEGFLFDHINTNYLLGYNVDQLQVISSLQKIHDNSPTCDWYTRLTNLFEELFPGQEFPNDAIRTTQAQ